MNCNHKQYKCTDNRFFCLICGAEIADPFAVKEDTDRARRRNREYTPINATWPDK